MTVMRVNPQTTGIACGTHYLLLRPVNRKMRDSKSLLCFGLPAIVNGNGPNKRNRMILLATYQHFCIQIA